jgi:hypothetical protein
VSDHISDTPRTDCAWKPDGGDGYPTVDVDLARQLERELHAANERIKRLEDIINRAACWFFQDGSDSKIASGMLTILEEGRKP